MRHSVYGKKLSRDINERDALFKSLVQSLILSKSIQTTQTKAKAIKGLVDKVINQAKDESTRRLFNQFITRKTTQEKLVKELIPQLQDRNSGYTSVVKMGRRQGDGAMMVKMTLLLNSKDKIASVEKKVEKTSPKEVKEGKEEKKLAKKEVIKS